MMPTTIRQILVPVDFSSCSRAALEFAGTLAKTLGASLVVLFVGEKGSELEIAAQKAELHGFVASAKIQATERFETGDARERIVTIAERDGFDLIVLGTHGRTGRSRMLAGSVAESVVRTASRPVLTVREP